MKFIKWCFSYADARCREEFSFTQLLHVTAIALGCCHVLLLLLFWEAGVYPMAVINIFSILTYITCYHRAGRIYPASDCDYRSRLFMLLWLCNRKSYGPEIPSRHLLPVVIWTTGFFKIFREHTRTILSLQGNLYVPHILYYKFHDYDVFPHICPEHVYDTDSGPAQPADSAEFHAGRVIHDGYTHGSVQPQGSNEIF